MLNSIQDSIVEEDVEAVVVKTPYRTPFKRPVKLSDIKADGKRINKRLKHVPQSVLGLPALHSGNQGAVVLKSITIRLGGVTSTFKTETITEKKEVDGVVKEFLITCQIKNKEHLTEQKTSYKRRIVWDTGYGGGVAMNLDLLMEVFLTQTGHHFGPNCSQSMIIFGCSQDSFVWRGTVVDIDGVPMNAETTILGVDAPSEKILVAYKGTFFLTNYILSISQPAVGRRIVVTDESREAVRVPIGEMTILPMQSTFIERRAHFATTDAGKELRSLIKKYNFYLQEFCKTHHVGGAVSPQTVADVAQSYAEQVAVFSKFVCIDCEELGLLLYNATSAMLRNAENASALTIYHTLLEYVQENPSASRVEKMRQRMNGLSSFVHK
ncbi:endoglucanase [Acrasis kona]|uniref:Endoglucanase n=1 Tax=Acrasis kona TaxID=1008807 RepID=A0AAW2ZPE2_9EUKA